MQEEEEEDKKEGLGGVEKQERNWRRGEILAETGQCERGAEDSELLCESSSMECSFVGNYSQGVVKK